MKKILLVTLPLLYLIGASLDAQVSVGYNTDGNTLSLSADVRDRLTGEFRVNTSYYNQASWSHNDRGVVQFYVLTNLFSAADAILYAGGGLGINLLSESDKWISINIPVGIKINPFSKLPHLFITGEYNPMLVVENGIPVIHSISVGFRYKLIREE